MSIKHSNISVFVPHIGCPNKCSFCNQRHITGTYKAPNAADVEKAVITAVKAKKYDPATTEIAFFRYFDIDLFISIFPFISYYFFKYALKLSK